MSNANNANVGIVNQLKSMLTNHRDRPEYTLTVFLDAAEGHGDNVVAEFEIFANDPEQKIKEKVEKLRVKGGITTLKIMELVKVTEDRYALRIGI